MKNILKALCGICLILGISGCATTLPPDIEICSNLTDPFDVNAEKHQGYCKRSMSDTERDLIGEPWKNKVRTAVMIDFDDYLILNKWIRKQCAQFSNECIKKQK